MYSCDGGGKAVFGSSMSNRYSLTAPAAVCALLAITGAPAVAQGLSEHDVVLRALALNPGIRVTVNNRAIDSLRLLAARSEWLPELSVSADGGLDLSDGSTSSGVSLSATQNTPGGGTIELAGTDREPSGDRSDNVSLSFTQPILHDAWRYSSPAYDIRVANLNDTRSLLSLRKELAKALSDVRQRYWDLVVARELLAVSGASVTRLERVLAAERTRFAIGEASELDTLRASLEYLKAYRNNLQNGATYRRQLRELADILAMPADSIALPPSPDFSVAPLPEPQVLLQSIRSYDPDRAEFAVLLEELSLELGRSRQHLLPDVSLSLSHTQTAPSGDWAASSGDPVLKLVASYAFPTRQKRIAIQQARLSLRNKQVEAEDYERVLLTQVGTLSDEWETQRQSLAVEKLAMRTAERVQEASKVGYEVGTVPQLDYLESMEQYESEQYALLNQQIMLKKKELVFDKLTGNVFTRFGVQVQ